MNASLDGGLNLAPLTRPFLAAGADRLPADYHSGEQHYQLYVPPNYRPTKAWPLVVFVSPGDDPLGWRSWQRTCEAHDVLFCAAYGAGNRSPPGRRVRHGVHPGRGRASGVVLGGG